MVNKVTIKRKVHIMIRILLTLIINIWIMTFAVAGQIDSSKEYYKVNFETLVKDKIDGVNDCKHTLKWLLKGAVQRDSDAQHVLGIMYAEGICVSRDEKEAIKWLLKAVSQHHSDAQYTLGAIYENSNDYKEARKWYLKADEQQNAYAQFRLGEMYRYNHVLQNFKEAIKWYRKAAEQQHSNAQLALGSLYEYGYGVPQDYEEARKWYLKAAEQQNSDAQYILSTMYAFGLVGFPKDYIKAHMWSNISATHGDKNAADFRNMLAEKMSWEQIVEAQRLVREWKPKPNKVK